MLLGTGGRALLRLQKFWKNTVARSCCLARGHVLFFDFRNFGKTLWHGRAAWHGGTVLLLWSSGLDFAGLCCFWCFYILSFWDVFGCDVGHLKTLALVPIDVYVAVSYTHLTLPTKRIV